MKHNKKDEDDPKPLNFDRDRKPKEDSGKPFLLPEDFRGDNEEEQYYEEEETLSPEEVKKRKQEGTM